MRKWIAGAGVIAIAFVGALVGNAAMHTSQQIQVDPVTVDVDAKAAAERLSRAVQIETVSTQGAEFEGFPFLELHDLLEHSYPLVHKTLKREIVADYSLLYTWRGSDESLAPMLLMAHQDVVPVEAGTEDAWTHPPFSGAIEDGTIWGRGTMDDKNNVLAQLEAVEMMIADGFQPKRTIYLAYGHDEEIGGTGAVATAALLKERGVRLYLVLDEGGAIVSNSMPGLDAAPAYVGISEKGYVTVELVARSEGGHSSMPPPHTASGRIGAAVARLEANPMPAAFAGPAGDMLDALGREMGFGMKFVFANRWLLGPVVKAQMLGKPASAAMLRTTTAVTMLEGSVKENVLPQVARARVNFRILPGDTIDSVVAHVRETIDDDEIEVIANGDIGSNPSPISRIDGPEFAALERSIREIFPSTPVAPFLVLGATDARHYAGLSDCVYRFTPNLLENQDLKRIHGTDEAVGVENYAKGIGFYVRFVQNTAGAEIQSP